jgi:HK97 family phage prohead protease
VTVFKTLEQSLADGRDVVMSDATTDAYGDRLECSHPDNWDLRRWNKNPIALLNHASEVVIGKYTNTRVENGALRGVLHLAPKGTSPRLDEVRALIDAKILVGVSVGFRPLEFTPLPGSNGGRHYTRMELLECSIVSVPANENALMDCRSLGISKETQRLIFGEEDRRLEDAFAVRARALAALKRADELIAREFEASAAGQRKKYEEEIIAAYTRQAKRHPQDPLPFTPSEGGHGTWRGEKLPGPTWRGKPIR